MQQQLRAEIGAELGSDVRAARPIAGGCISPAWRADLENGTTIFIKSLGGSGPSGLFQAEAMALQHLRAARVVRVPEMLHVAAGWIALEWLPPSAGTADDWSRLGRGLALLHRTSRRAYGWDADNFIGALPQRNEWSRSWSEFWIERRLRPLMDDVASSFGTESRRGFETLLRRVANMLDVAESEGPSLLHGDLWNGNVHVSDGGPALIDPSSYFGHREVDLAMARLFGGFPHQFYAAYEAEWPLLPDAAARLPLYQLYYLLVHVRLFGDGYVAQTERALKAVLRYAV
jgi:fructosamine-3-kinase